MDQCAPLRLLRGLLVTALVLALAGAGHVAAGGVLPPLIVLIGLGLGVLGPVAWAAGRGLTPGRLVVLLGAAQLALHEAFTVLSTAPACGPATGPHGSHVGPACPPAPALELGHHVLSGHGPAMLIGHGVAVLTTALVLARTDAALGLALEWLRPLLAPARPARPLLGPPRLCAPPAGHPVLVWRGLRRDRVRGPPAAGVLRRVGRV